MGANENFVAALEGFRVNARVGLDGEEDAVDWSENFVDFPDLGLVVQIRPRVEVGDHVVSQLIHHFVFARVHELAQLCVL